MASEEVASEEMASEDMLATPQLMADLAQMDDIKYYSSKVGEHCSTFDDQKNCDSACSIAFGELVWVACYYHPAAYVLHLKGSRSSVMLRLSCR
jgi:hypothetical protein